MFKGGAQPASIFLFSILSLLTALAQEGGPIGRTAVQMTVTVHMRRKTASTPELKREDIIVQQGKDRLQVTSWTPIGFDQSPLDLFILIDESSRQSIVSQFVDLREFINSLPKSTFVGLGYMSKGKVQVEQNLTNRHWMAANALRPPMESPVLNGSPYLSVIDLMNRWPESTNRREIVMITDGIDRLHGWPYGQDLSHMPSDVSSASAIAQRAGTIIHAIYSPGVGWRGINYREVANAQSAMAKLASETGGESFFREIFDPVTLRPYLDRLQISLGQRYRLEFNAVSGKEPSLQPVKVTSEIAGAELDSADNVWVASQ